MPSCNLSALIKGSADNCTYTPAGVGDRIYIFDVDDIAVDSRAPGNSGFYNPNVFTNVELFAIDIKTDSGKVTSSKSEDDESRSLVATAVINYSFDKFMPIDTAIAFMNVGVIVPITSDKAYVVMSPYRRTKYTCEFDSGDTYDSDHGFTITFTCSPVLYACPMVLTGSGSGKLNLSSATKEYDTSAYTDTEYKSVTIAGDTTTVAVDSTITFTATTDPTGGTVTWKSSDTSKATVSNGVVKGIAAGTGIVITAKCGTVSATKTISVTA